MCVLTYHFFASFLCGEVFFLCAEDYCSFFFSSYFTLTYSDLWSKSLKSCFISDLVIRFHLLFVLRFDTEMIEEHLLLESNTIFLLVDFSLTLNFFLINFKFKEFLKIYLHSNLMRNPNIKSIFLNDTYR